MKNRSLLCDGTNILLRAAMAFSMLIMSGCLPSTSLIQTSNYFNQDIVSVSQLEKAALSHYTSVVGDNYVDDQTLRAALKDKVIPLYSEFVWLLEQIRPANDNIREVHANYIMAAREYDAGFRALLAAVETNDPAAVAEANKHIAQGYEAGQKWRTAFLALCKREGIKLTPISSGQSNEVKDSLAGIY